MTAQLGLALEGGSGLSFETGGELGAGDDIPAGPYSVGMTVWLTGDGDSHYGIPYVVRCGDGRAVAGHVPSREIAQAIADALNRAAR